MLMQTRQHHTAALRQKSKVAAGERRSSARRREFDGADLQMFCRAQIQLCRSWKSAGLPHWKEKESEGAGGGGAEAGAGTESPPSRAERAGRRCGGLRELDGATRQGGGAGERGEAGAMEPNPHYPEPEELGEGVEE
jgi:hypothetical protein